MTAPRTPAIPEFADARRTAAALAVHLRRRDRAAARALLVDPPRGLTLALAELAAHLADRTGNPDDELTAWITAAGDAT